MVEWRIRVRVVDVREKEREDSGDGKGFKMQTNIGTKSRLNYHLNSTACHFKQWMSHVPVHKGRANNLISSQQAVSSLYTSCVFPPIDLKSISWSMPCCNLLQHQTLTQQSVFYHGGSPFGSPGISRWALTVISCRIILVSSLAMLAICIHKLTPPPKSILYEPT